jgi:hypothetical protein
VPNNESQSILPTQQLSGSALKTRRKIVTTLLELNFVLSVTTSIFLVDKDSKWRAAIDTVQ